MIYLKFSSETKFTAAFVASTPFGSNLYERFFTVISLIFFKASGKTLSSRLPPIRLAALPIDRNTFSSSSTRFKALGKSVGISTSNCLSTESSSILPATAQVFVLGLSMFLLLFKTSEPFFNIIEGRSKRIMLISLKLFAPSN